MKNVLVVCADYPEGNKRSLAYVHARNLRYIKNGINVIVLNFSAKREYIYEGIKVISLEQYKSNLDLFNNYVLVCHAPNIRNHWIFLKKYASRFQTKVIIFHGHEIVMLNKLYPREYIFFKKNFFKRTVRTIYDKFKVYLWKRYILKADNSFKMIFVSESLLNDFLDLSKISLQKITCGINIINNCVGEIFETYSYNNNAPKKYDAVTIRTNIDDSVYCIDIICEIAKNNPKSNFLLIGKGNYFNYIEKPNNLKWIKNSMSHEDLISYINSSRIALMPTRRDSQGVMSCELATFGIPVITSDLNVCKEMFATFKNVRMYSNKDFKRIDIKKELEAFDENNSEKNEKFLFKNTILKEIQIIKNEGELL